ncbi:DUF3530 family protein [Colwelliaceae bacterium 6441]
MTRNHLVFFSLIILFLSIVGSEALAAPQENTDPKASAETQDKDKNKKSSADETVSEKNNDENADNSSNSPRIKSRRELKIIAPTNAFKNKESDLKHYLPEKIIHPLLVGPEDHITLINTNNTENNKGIMVLLPDWQQTAASPKALNALRKVLPDQGWTTISVLPPNKPLNYPSQMIDKKQREEENKTSLEEYQQKLAKILTAVTEKAKTFPGIIVVVAEGHNAALLFNIYQQELSELPTALVILSAHLNDDLANLSSATSLSQLELPVLDLHLSADNYLVSKNIKLRKKLVNKELKSNFRQKKIYNIQTSYYPKDSLIKEINGWLKFIGW